MLARLPGQHRSWAGVPNTQPQSSTPLDESWVEPALAAAEAGEPFSVSSPIANQDRAVGSRIAGELALRRAQKELPAEISLAFTGTAGQSFGAFLVEGMKLLLDGWANDFVAKGLSGGEVVLRPRGLARHDSGHHVILGNVALYGATSGHLYAAGRAGERFAVRNSGATAVVEGVGDHGCEYMTGGTVAVLGEAGSNFGAGMTGGLAWVYDEDGEFVAQQRFHPDFVQPSAYAEVDRQAQEALRALVMRHVQESESSLGTALLEDWSHRSLPFVLLTPKPQV